MDWRGFDRARNHMGKPEFAFDNDTFLRASSLFVAKRDRLTDDAIQALAFDTLSRLADKALRDPAFEAKPVGDVLLQEFCEALLEPQPDKSLAFIEQQRALGLTRLGVYLGYISAAAQWLGEQWQDDRLSSYEVASATGHLYALMRAMRAERPDFARDARRSALFATVPGEDHGVGITLAADLFRETGWKIDLQLGADHDTLLAHVEATQPHIIGLSFSSQERLEALVRLVVNLRLTTPQAIIGVAPPRGTDEEALRNCVDIDLVFNDARSACAELDDLIQARR
ncbi:cobalamin-dependent protein [Hyphomonadaceae bacterium BL14]|nr:cobalamin-dependent protein [Hyphomonadaceae bacterium BL14]